jgi:hypothetical protein
LRRFGSRFFLQILPIDASSYFRVALSPFLFSENTARVKKTAPCFRSFCVQFSRNMRAARFRIFSRPAAPFGASLGN